MANSFSKKINSLQELQTRENCNFFNGMKRGVEKESLRITPDGKLSNKPHPKALGSALTHPYITTDYSEALLEFITPAYDSIDDALHMLSDIHHFTYQNIEEELLWVNSMPCILGEESSIPIADYGTSNIGQMKHIYRVGLWHRYGRMMQTIAGIHYNVSYPESFWQTLQTIEEDTQPLQPYISSRYFDLIRNFQRFSWLALYLFGASPAVCSSFLKDKNHSLELLHKHTWYLPHATSLRMGDLGYQNNAQSDLMICYNSLETYIETLSHAINTPHESYENIGVLANGEYQQLNANILQIENEYYGSIRPKRNALSGEKPTRALKRGGVEYIELRCVDLDPFSPIGLSKEQALFLEVFASYCLLQDSPECDEKKYTANNQNLSAIVNEGRNPDLMLERNGETINAKTWAMELLEGMLAIAETMDDQHPEYRTSIEAQINKITGTEQTTSELILDTLRADNTSFYDFAMQQAHKTKSHFQNETLDQDTRLHFIENAKTSLQEQTDIENSDTMSFDKYLDKYFNNEL